MNVLNNKISHVLNNRISAIAKEYPQELQIVKVIEIWCHELGLDSNNIVNIIDRDAVFLENCISAITGFRFLKIAALMKSGNPKALGNNVEFAESSGDGIQFIRKITYNKKTDKDIEPMNQETIFLLGLLLLGCVLLYDKLSKRSLHSYVVIFTINVKHQELVNSLRQFPKIPSSFASDIYEATRGLWFGSKPTFDRISLSKLFKKEYIYNKNDYSYNDSFLVQIETNKNIQKLYPNESIDSLQRLKAFESLLNSEHRIVEIKRIPLNDFKDTDIYSR